jgi:4-carboxymuconolactone decarboxylase
MRFAMSIAAVVLCLARLPAFAAEGKASRLPDLPDPPTDPIVRKAMEERKAAGGSIINLTLTSWHSAKYAQATNQLAGTIRNEGKTSRFMRELAILRTAYVVGSEYELAQHRALAKVCEYPAAKIEAITQWPKSADVFDDRERAMLGYVDQMTHGGDVDDATFEKFSSLFTPEEIVEISVTVSNYFGNGLLTKALKVKLETDGRVTYPGKC